jgi:hypothetical protein
LRGLHCVILLEVSVVSQVRPGDVSEGAEPCTVDSILAVQINIASAGGDQGYKFDQALSILQVASSAQYLMRNAKPAIFACK